jgi:hypothetical protein
MENIKAYYKACTTTKNYIIVEDLSCNYKVTKYLATNNDDKYLNDNTVKIISCEYYYENLDVLNYLFNSMMQNWTKLCYHYTFENFLFLYDLSINQFNKIKKLIK